MTCSTRLGGLPTYLQARKASEHSSLHAHHKSHPQAPQTWHSCSLKCPGPSGYVTNSNSAIHMKGQLLHSAQHYSSVKSHTSATYVGLHICICMHAATSVAHRSKADKLTPDRMCRSQRSRALTQVKLNLKRYTKYLHIIYSTLSELSPAVAGPAPALKSQLGLSEPQGRYHPKRGAGYSIFHLQSHLPAKASTAPMMQDCCAQQNAAVATQCMFRSRA